MQSKGFIKLIAVLLALACVYQLSFTFKTRSVEKKAAEYAAQFPLEEHRAETPLCRRAYRRRCS